ncbi:DUF1838 family protein [Gammaproteobacteria bacterium]|jgi:hypothetical protein|nr:DUF1838 family protein [Gammaproteobacteria bacterium]|tara:strand:+ start:706 stop:1578 length:873 start_codon:yes stop_codon:yes gene_type:complete
MRLSRRSLLHSTAAIAGFGMLDSTNAKINIHSSIDLSNPMDNVNAFSKLAGSLKQETVHYFYDGTIYGMASEESYPLFNYSGVMKFVWQPIKNNSYRYRMFDIGCFSDLITGVPLEEFKNPFTNEVIKVLQPRAGPYDFFVKPEVLDWRQSGDQLWISNSQGLQMPNRLDPEKWPLGSTGKVINFRYIFGYRGKLSDIEDQQTSNVHSLQFFSEISPWYPFLRMGKKPGFNYWSLQGNKIKSLSDVSPLVLAYIDKNEPGFFDNDQPWIKTANAYSQYMQEMKNRPITER